MNHEMVELMVLNELKSLDNETIYVEFISNSIVIIISPRIPRYLYCKVLILLFGRLLVSHAALLPYGKKKKQKKSINPFK